MNDTWKVESLVPILTTVYWLHKLFAAGILTVGALFNVVALFHGVDYVVHTYFTTTR